MFWNCLVSFALPTEAPKIHSFLSSPTDLVPFNTPAILTCEADGILPTMFNISFNGKDPERIPSGFKFIDTFTEDNVGTYKCIAFNIIGSSIGKELKLDFRDICQKATTSPTTSDHGSGASVGTTGKKECWTFEIVLPLFPLL